MPVWVKVAAAFAFGWMLQEFVTRVLIPRYPALAPWWYAGWTSLSTVLAAAAFATGDIRDGVWCAVLAAVFGVYWWWHNRKRRRRAPGLAGAKSRARIAVLVRRQREASSTP